MISLSTKLLTRLLMLVQFTAVACLALAQPTVTSLTITDPNPTNATSLNWNVTFDQPVTGVSTSNFTTSATGTTGLVNSVAPAPGNQTWMINVSGVSGTGELELDLSNPVSIMGTTAPLTQTYSGEYYTVDNTAPYVVAITRADASPTSASTVTFNVQFSEKVYNVSSINFAPGGSLSGTVGAVSTADNQTWTVQINGVSGSGTVRLDLTDTSFITDAAGNYLASDYNAGESYTIDQDGPAITCITRLDANPTTATTVSFMAAFNEPATSVTIANFTVSVSGTTTGTITSVTNGGDGTTWTITVSSVDGAGQLRVDLVDPAGIEDMYGNPATATSIGCESYDVDREGPMIQSIVAAESPTSSTVVVFLVTFDEPVTTGTTADFAVSGSATGVVSLVENNGNVTSVTVSSVSGPGSLCLTAVAPSSIADLMGNAVQNVPYSGPCAIICADAAPITILYPAEGETTSTTADNFAWNAPLPDLTYHLYFDGNYIETTTATFAPIPKPLTSGAHNWMVEVDGACTSGTQVNFNVLDGVTLLFPRDGFESCISPRFFNWTDVEGATTYTLTIGDGFTTNSYETTATEYEVNTTLTSGTYTWTVEARNEFGSTTGGPSKFSVTDGDTRQAWILRTNGTVYALERIGTTLYVGGDFTSIMNPDGTWISRANLAAVDVLTSKVQDWHPEVNNAVYTIKRTSETLVLGGNFTRISGQDRLRVAEINRADVSTSVTAFQPHVNGPVYSVEMLSTGTVIIGGDFTKINTVPAFNFANPGLDVGRLAIADLNTSLALNATFTSAGLSANATVRDILVDGPNVYIAGVFSKINEATHRGLVLASVSTSNSLALQSDFKPGIDLYVYKLAKQQNALYFGGSFNTVLGEARLNAAALDVSSTTSPKLLRWNPQPGSAVYEVKVGDPGTGIYIGGTFTLLRHQRAAYLAEVDPIEGYPLSCSINSDRVVYAVQPIAAAGLFIGGQVTVSGTSAEPAPISAP